MASLSTPQVKVLCMSLFHFFRGLDTPPAKEIFIPAGAIKPVRGEDNSFFATLRYLVEYCGPKEHSVRIKFKVDPQGRFLN
ncbi:hypothetical protein, partial [Acinetobacter sp.]|uniref:hypothetical protein n=1 Tax=Acinetobacter sp. TaxID=472 RepID=UPI003751A5AA